MVEQVGDQIVEPAPGANLTVEYFLKHALAVNKIFFTAIEAYLAPNLQQAWQIGATASLPHASTFARFNKTVRENMICEMTGDLVEQMEKTCKYDENVGSYANLAALLMQGFYDQLFNKRCPGANTTHDGFRYGIVIVCSCYFAFEFLS